jgi:DNA-binding MarR family transcriptional regulator
MQESNARGQEADGQPWQRRAVLERLYVDQGKSQSEIADELGCTRSTVSRWLDKHDIGTREKGDPKVQGETPWRDEDTLRELYLDEELTTYEIGDRLGCQDTTVARWLRNYGIEVRKRGGKHPPKHPKLSNGEWLRDQYHRKRRSTKDIADQLDVSPSNVRRWMNRAGVELHGQLLKYPTLNDEEKLREWYEDEILDTNEIADRIGCSQSAVCHHMDRLGIERRSQDELTGEMSPRWKGGYTEFRGTNWPKLRAKALEADDYRCQGCGRNEDDHRAEHGVGLHVHHIRPVTEFDDPADADTVDNLVPLCRDCHNEWEGIPLRPTTD